MGNIPSDVDEKAISAFLQDRNIRVVDVKLSKYDDSTNVAFVSFAGTREADVAVIALDSKKLNGSTITAVREDIEDFGI